MDVGLNNKNMFEHEYLKDIVFLVEASDVEYHYLWLNYSKDSKEFKDWSKVEWEEISKGFILKIGEFGGEAIWVEFRFAFINGHKVAFYYATSRVVHHGIIEEFLISNFQRTNDTYTRWNHTDAINFHNCIIGLNRLDKKPRNTIYKK